ncbi:hypothetical protein [Methylobacterium sp. E-046]|uniref:hypothetical protein n=1 Tax=Methylobacterium sp. E-046 TaxID=2836576 RepID=UPI001FBAAE84|nr:hypothetical protein [Methylobacterium sp. E-046]MCJ2098936.1 hypothetical protein [Methylobacterium sp. E-046]
MAGIRQWRPIAECPPNLRRAVVFDPEMTWLGRHDGSVVDERVSTAERHTDGRWHVERAQGDGAFYEPTHFLEPGVPKDQAAIPDVEALRAKLDAEDEARRADQARAARENEARERGVKHELESFWADPDKRLRALSGDP